MATNAKDIIPAHVTHPGSVLKSELKARGIKQKDFAQAIGMPAPNLSEIIKGKRHITETIAIRLENALGIPFQTWMNLQNRYHYVLKRKGEIESAEMTAAREEQSLQSFLNMAVIYEFFGINEPTSSARLTRLKQSLSITLDEFRTIETNTVGFFKRNDRLKIDGINMRTWLLLALSEAAKSEITLPYSPENGLIAASKIAQDANAGRLTTSGLQEILNENGIIFCHVPHLMDAPIDAYSVMIGDHPAIVATYRHNDMDKLAFDILHEIGHILHHLSSKRSYISIENGYSSQSKEEKEADEFANNMLIAPAIWKSILSARTRNLSPHAIISTVADEAARHGISPSIAAARYRHDVRCHAVRGYRPPKIY